MLTVNVRTGDCCHCADWFFPLMCFLLLCLFCVAAQSSHKTNVRTPPSFSTEITSYEDHAPPAAISTFANTFRSSLEMKENVDFLLTPAILVQQAAEDDIIIYPSE